MMDLGDKLKGRRLLVVEDDLFISTALRELFLLAGAESVELSTSIEQGVDMADEFEFDAAVLDLGLPDGEMIDLAASLSHRGVWVLFHSGATLPDDLRNAIPEAGYAQKPSEPSQLVDLISHALAEK